MTTSINTNIAAYYAQANLRKAGDAAQSSIARLSSGNAIVRASDNVAGLAIGTVLRTNVSTLQTASSNASQGSTLLQVADGAVSSLGEILQRQKALSVQANSGTLSDTERGYLDQEFQQLNTEYNQIVSTTNFNGVNLLNGSISGASNLTAKTSSTQSVVGLPTSGNVISTATLAGTFNDKVTGSQSGAQVSITSTSGTANDVTINLNGVTFIAKAVDLHSASATITATAAGGATIAIALTGAGAVANDATTAAALAKSIQSDLSNTSVYQTRQVDNTAGSATSIVAAKFDGTALQGLDGNSFTVKSNAFTATNTPAISNFQINPYSSTANGKLSVQINGQTYSVALTSGTLTGNVTLTDESDSNSTFKIALGSTSLNVGTASGASSITSTLNSVFGNGSAGGLSFQVGNTSSDNIGISISDLSSSKVFLDNSGASKTLSIATQSGAQAASDVLDNAIDSLTTARSNIGALQERFDYASDTLAVSIQNLDAARGTFLDTDISAESTKYATEQVQQQAAISVLAQANQLPQNLLKLIGQ